MLAAINDVFGGPPSKDLREEHKAQKEQFIQWEAKALAAKNVSVKLNLSYQRARSSLPPLKFAKLKSMIKNAIRESEEIQKRSKGQVTDNQGGGLKKFKSLTAKIAEDSRYYSEKRSSELESEIKGMEDRVAKFKEEFDIELKKISTLAANYEASKNLNPVQRYSELKRIIKAVILV